MYLTVTVLGIASLVGACGQKGPLYLPEETTAVSESPGADVPTPSPAPSDAAAASDTP
ncbi:MAG: lipoprotein [Thiocapsa sp.]|nr:lipoprotein [Thiocapsa sp.]